MKAWLSACVLLFVPAMDTRPVSAACVIENSACYPWRIEPGADRTVLLEVVPNNAVTSSIYRVCLCAPKSSVTVQFDFLKRRVEIGRVEVTHAGPVCRDFRIETSRKSRLLLRRPENGGKALLEGCYTAFGNTP